MSNLIIKKPSPIYACHNVRVSTKFDRSLINFLFSTWYFYCKSRNIRVLFKMGDLSLQYTLDEALSTIGFGNFHVCALIFAGLGWCGDAIEVMLLSIVGPAIRSEWRLSGGQESMLTSVVFAGTLVGGYFWGLISDVYGRRTACIGAIAFTAVAGVLSTFSPGYETLLILLCLLGFGVGGGHVFTSWFLEFAPTSNRGSWTVSISIFWACGTIFEAALAWIIMPRLGWRWLIALSCIPSLLVLLIALLIPESPRFLCMKDRTTKAQRVLEKVAKFNQAKLPPGTLVFDPLSEHDEECVSSEKSPLLSPGRKRTGDSETGLSSVLKLFSPKLVKTTLLLWVLYFGNVFAYYGLIFMTSELSSGQGDCRQRVKLSQNAQDATSYMEIFITSSAELISAIFAATIVDRAGRKLTMGITSVLGFILFLPLVWLQNDIVTTALLFGARIFVPAGCTVLGLYAIEIYPTSLRSTGVGVASSVGRIGGIVCPLVAVLLVNDCHKSAAVVLFEIVIVLLGLCVFLLPVETNGKDLNDVVQSVEEESTVRINYVS